MIATTIELSEREALVCELALRMLSTIPFGEQTLSRDLQNWGVEPLTEDEVDNLKQKLGGL